MHHSARAAATFGDKCGVANGPREKIERVHWLTMQHSNHSLYCSQMTPESETSVKKTSKKTEQEANTVLAAALCTKRRCFQLGDTLPFFVNSASIHENDT